MRAAAIAAMLCPLVLVGAAAEAATTLHEQAKTWRNPRPMHESWRHGVELSSDGGLWQLALVDGAGVALPAPYHAGEIKIEREAHHQRFLSLLVKYDPTFDAESDNDWQPPMAASTRYNNAFLTGLSGWMPRPTVGRAAATEVVVEFTARWPRGYESLGTSGVWLEQQGTFDSQGLMQIPFQAAGLSYTSSLSFLFPGLAIEGVTGFAPDSYALVPSLDISEWHLYALGLRWASPTSMTLTLAVDGSAVSEVPVVPFGPFEVQVWRDNYLVVADETTGYRISFVNFPPGWIDPFEVGDLRVFERRVANSQCR